MPKKIKRSVGAGGANAYADAATVQYLLNCVPKGAGGPVAELAVDGIVGPLTMAAIRRFQMAKSGKGDGRVDPGGPALAQLQSYDPYPNLPMPLPSYGGGGAKKVPAGKYAANQAIVHGITEAIAAAVAAASGVAGPVSPGWKTGPAKTGKWPESTLPGVAGKVAGVGKAAAQAAGTAIEEAAMGGKHAPGGGGMLGPVQKAAEAAMKAAEAAAKQAGLKVPQGGYQVPGTPAGAGAAYGMGALAQKVAEVAQRAAKAAGEGGKTIDPVKMPMPPAAPGGAGGAFAKIIQTAAEAAASAVKQMSYDGGGGGKAGGAGGGGATGGNVKGVDGGGHGGGGAVAKGGGNTTIIGG